MWTVANTEPVDVSPFFTGVQITHTVTTKSKGDSIMNKLITCLTALFLLVSFSAAYAAPTTNSDMKGKSAEEQIKVINEMLDDILESNDKQSRSAKIVKHTGTTYLSAIFKDVDTSVVIGFYEHKYTSVRRAVDNALRMRKDKATEAIDNALETGSPRIRFQLLCLQNNRGNSHNKPTAEMCAMLDTIIHDKNIPVFMTDYKRVRSKCLKTEDWPIDIIAYCNRLLDSESLNDRITAVDLLHYSCDDITGSVPRLLSMLQNPDKIDASNFLLKGIINVLAYDKQSADKVIPICNKYLSHKDESVQLMASRMLYYLDYERDKQARFIIDKFKENQTTDTFNAVSAIHKDGSELIPMIRELLKSEDKSIRAQAKMAYMAVGGLSEDILKVMKENITSVNSDERQEAVNYFRGKSWDAEIADYLLETLKTGNIDNELKYELCSMLINKKGMFEDILPSIIELLNTRYPEELSVKAANLLKFGGGWDDKRDATSAVPALLSMMETEDSAVMKQIREVILKIEDDHEIVVNKLIELVKNSNDNICLNAISQLGYMKEKSINAIGALADAYNRDNETIKTNSILAIRTIFQSLKHNQKVSKEDLIKVIELGDFRISQYASNELINRFEDYDGIINHLLLQAETSDDNTRNRIYGTIGKMGNKALSALPTIHKNALDDESHNSQPYSAIKKIVASVYPSTVIDIPTFLNLLECRDGDLLRDVIGVLIAHDCNYDKIAGKLVEIMHNKDSKYREYAIRELGNLGENAISALPALLEIGKSRDYSLQDKALESIRRVVDAYGPDDEVTIPFVIKMIETRNKDCCEKALGIISSWGTYSVQFLPVLKKLLEDDKRSSANYGYDRISKEKVSGAMFGIIMRMDSKTKVDPELLLDLLELNDGMLMTIVADKYMLLTDDYSKLIEKLVGFIEHGNDNVRSKAVDTFSSKAIKLKNAVPALKQLLNRLDDDKRERISQIIKYMEKRNENAQKK
jgi:HEAT repeat protein